MTCSDVLLSGTVGAALHGYFHGLPSIALSIRRGGGRCILKLLPDWRALWQANSSTALHLKEMLLNINLPNLPLDEIKGIQVTRLASKGTTVALPQKSMVKKETLPYLVRKELQWNGGEGTDAWAVDEGRISITPLQGEMGIAPGRNF